MGLAVTSALDNIKLALKMRVAICLRRNWIGLGTNHDGVMLCSAIMNCLLQSKIISYKADDVQLVYITTKCA